MRVRWTWWLTVAAHLTAAGLVSSGAAAQPIPFCRVDPPASGSCPGSPSASFGAACTCRQDGSTLPGRIVLREFPHASGTSRGENLRGMFPSYPTPSAGGGAMGSIIGAPTPTSRPPAYLPMPPSAASGAARPPTVASARPGRDSEWPPLSLQPARSMRRGADIPEVGVGAYGIAALVSGPTPDSQARLERFCRAFNAALPSQSSLPASVDIADQMLTYWPVTAPSPEECPAMLTRYDLYAGQNAIRDAGARGNDVSGRGPFLIGWSPSNSRGVPDAVVLVLDLSRLESERSFVEAFEFWQRRVVEDPSLWRNGFSMTLVRLAARDFADQHGTDILKALHLASD